MSLCSFSNVPIMVLGGGGERRGVCATGVQLSLLLAETLVT